MTKHFGAFLRSGKHGQGLDLESEHLLLNPICRLCNLMQVLFLCSTVLSCHKGWKEPHRVAIVLRTKLLASSMYSIDVITTLICYYYLDLLIVLDISKNTRVLLSFLIQCNIWFHPLKRWVLKAIGLFQLCAFGGWVFGSRVIGQIQCPSQLVYFFQLRKFYVFWETWQFLFSNFLA